MNNDRITYKRNFQVGDHVHEHLSYETDARERETPEESFDRARNVVLSFHKKYYPQIEVNPEYAHLLSTGTTPASQYNSVSIINKESERIEISIDNCTSKPELLLLQSDAHKYGLEVEYVNKLKSFQ